ncbi:MAG: methionyl-tRNA formyltransferase [Spirochaetaceae bacterium]|jgi:methionyl-tRNA formyltransferase|nr:methionyl-tRNA formyltransferase [Spirochaetaceae bacterium]
MRILFAGSPAIAVPSLEALAELTLEGASHCLVGLLTNPDSRRGRRGDLLPTDTGAAAESIASRFAEKGLSFAVLKSEKLDEGAREAVVSLRPELLVSFAYGRIFGPKFLSLFPFGGINIHPSLLPKYRGASPIPAVILGGERETGITIQKLALKMDSGAILAREHLLLNGDETTASLSELAAQKSALLLVSFLRGLGAALPEGELQDEGGAVYTSLIKKEDGLMDWSLSAVELYARIRAYTPWPLCVTCHGEAGLYILEGRPYEGERQSDAVSEGGALPGTVLGIDKDRGILIQTGNGILCVSRLQYQAKKALGWREFLNGSRGFIGSVLGCQKKRGMNGF